MQPVSVFVKHKDGRTGVQTAALVHIDVWTCKAGFIERASLAGGAFQPVSPAVVSKVIEQTVGSPALFNRAVLVVTDKSTE